MGRGVHSEEGKTRANPFEERWNLQTKRSSSQKAKTSKWSARHRPSDRNDFHDQRVGENKPELSEEDRYLARLQRERTRGSRKRKRYNLSDALEEEKLIAQASQGNAEEFPSVENQNSGKYSLLKDDFDDESLLSNSDVEAGKEASSESIRKAEMKGGTEYSSREVSDVDEEIEPDGRTHREVMSEVMGKSKMFKALRQHTKAADEEQREELDKELPVIMSLLAKSNRWQSNNNGPVENKESSGFNYEATFQKLASERRAYAANRLKTEEEKEAEERSRLEKLEETRRARMDGLMDSDDEDEPTDYAANRKSDSRAARVTNNGFKAATSKKKSLNNSIGCQDSVPYFFDVCPSDTSELSQLLDSTEVKLRGVVIERLMKCFAVSLNPSVNVPKLQKLLSLLLERIQTLSVSRANELSAAAEEIDVLSRHVYALAVKYPSSAIEWSREQLYVMYQALQEKLSSLSDCWDVSQILLLRFISRLFPGSDVRHFVATPLQLLLSEALSRCRGSSETEFALSCFICSILLETCAASTRLSGQLVDFLCRGFAFVNAKSKGWIDVGSETPGKCHACGARVDNGNPLSLSDCVPAPGSTCKHLCLKISSALQRLSVAAAFRGRLSCIDLAYAPLLKTLDALSAGRSAVLAEIRKEAEKHAATRAALSLYTEKSIAIPKVLNPKFSAVNGVYRKHSRSRVRSESVEEKQASANRIRKALNKEQRGYARDLRKEAMLVAQHRSEIEAENRAHSTAKSREVQVFLENQQATWKQAAKKQKQLSGKRW